ncbi:MAG: ribosome-associated translation inhibitor RaiA [Candidatus Kinetoplastibacterium crithidii]|nr:MAG: ribosome-associated translation inhibitor RaiA [Candidatus Kinetoplastibacterium crithidii]
MDIQIIGKNIEVTQALHDYVSCKINHAIKHFTDVNKITVSLFIENEQHTVEVNINVDNKIIHCKASEKNLYTSLDIIAEKIEIILHKNKEKKQLIKHIS